MTFFTKLFTMLKTIKIFKKGKKAKWLRVKKSSSRWRECTCLLQLGFHSWTNKLLTIPSLWKGHVWVSQGICWLKEWNCLSHTWGTGLQCWQRVWILSNVHCLNFTLSRRCEKRRTLSWYLYSHQQMKR